jgi:hypothetical protein
MTEHDDPQGQRLHELRELRKVALQALADVDEARDVACRLEGRLHDLALEVATQFGYWGHSVTDGKSGLYHGGLSTLEEVWEILGWDDVQPQPELECDEPGCDDRATTGWPTRPGGTGPNGGYRRTCGAHWLVRSGDDASRAPGVVQRPG